MNQWPLVPLGDIFTIARGGSPRPIDAFITDDPNGVNWIMIGDAVEGSKYITGTKKRIRNEGVSRSRKVKPGDFLLTNSMSFGHPYILATSGCIHDGWLVLSPRDNNVDQDYFYHLLGSPLVYAQFQRLAAGAVVKNLNSSLVRGVSVPLPPFREQRRIADILDKADAIRRKRKETIPVADTLLRSAFLDMFGDPESNPKGWRTTTVGVLCDEYGGSLQTGPFGSQLHASDYSDEGTPVVMPQDLIGGRICLERIARVRDKHVRRLERHRLELGDVIFSRRGDVARFAVVGEDAIGWLCGTGCLRIRFGQSPVTGGFLKAELAHPAKRRWLEREAKGTTMPNLNTTILTGLPLRLPPLALQERFSDLVRHHEKAIAHLRASLSECEELFGGLVNHAFAGSVEGRC